jgi:hypothetical protein
MCYPVPCQTCGKTTWAGCGQHVADVQKTVPAAQWCAGHEGAAPQGGFLSKLFKR